MSKVHVIATASLLLAASLTGCLPNAKATYTDYVQAMLDCTYFNVQDKYMELTDSTAAEAQELYDSMVDYEVQLICEVTAVSYDYISDETYHDYQDLAVRVLEKANYTVQPAVKSGDTYHITVSCSPMDFLDILYDPVSAVLDNYTDAFGAYDFSDMDALENDPEYLDLEEAYAIDVLAELNKCVDEIGYYSPQNIIVEIEDDGEYYGVSDKSWNDIDDLLLGLDSNATE